MVDGFKTLVQNSSYSTFKKYKHTKKNGLSAQGWSYESVQIDVF